MLKTTMKKSISQIAFFGRKFSMFVLLKIKLKSINHQRLELLSLSRFINHSRTFRWWRQMCLKVNVKIWSPLREVRMGLNFHIVSIINGIFRRKKIINFSEKSQICEKKVCKIRRAKLYIYELKSQRIELRLFFL